MTDHTTVSIGSTDGVVLALHHLGGQGMPLLICHATGFHGRAYLPLARALAPHFDVWAADLRGHGESTPPTSGNFGWSGMAEDVRRILDHLGRPVVGVGHSMGGASIILAELAQPGSFTGAYLFEPIVLPPDFSTVRPENPLAVASRKRRAEFDSRAEALERYASRAPLSVLSDDSLAAYVQYGFADTPDGRVRLACEPEHEALTFEADEKVTYGVIEGMAFDAVIAAGASVPGISPADFAPAIVDAIEGATLRPHPELGHFGPLEAPDVIAAEIIGHFGSA